MVVAETDVKAATSPLPAQPTASNTIDVVAQPADAAMPPMARNGRSIRARSKWWLSALKKWAMRLIRNRSSNRILTPLIA